MDWVWCPECCQPAEIVWRRELVSTDGPVEHASLRCLAQHVLLMPTSGLTRADLADESSTQPVRAREDGTTG